MPPYALARLSRLCGGPVACLPTARCMDDCIFCIVSLRLRPQNIQNAGKFTRLETDMTDVWHEPVISFFYLYLL